MVGMEPVANEFASFADAAFAFGDRKCEFEDRLLEFIEFEKLGWDFYDRSLEIYGVAPEARLSEKARAFLFGSGFSIVYVNHTDKWESHYNRVGQELPWRRKYRSGGGWEINYMPDCWPSESKESGMFTVVGNPGVAPINS